MPGKSEWFLHAMDSNELIMMWHNEFHWIILRCLLVVIQIMIIHQSRSQVYAVAFWVPIHRWYRYLTLLVAPHISVAHGLVYTSSNCMRHERAKRSECTTHLKHGWGVHYTSWPKGVVHTPGISENPMRSIPVTRNTTYNVPHLWANQNAGIRGQQVQRGIMSHASYALTDGRTDGLTQCNSSTPNFPNCDQKGA